MKKEMLGMPGDTGWKKAISTDRDRLQSRLLVWVVGMLLGVAGLTVFAYAARVGHVSSLVVPLVLSFGFAVLVWMLRAATGPAAMMGFLICFILSQEPVVWTGFASYPISYPAIPALIALFVITFAATKYGRAKKEARGLAEPRKGRRASQIVANLGVAALCAALGEYDGCIAALAEAAADTVSSEIGQAVGGPAWLITGLRRVPAGTDGAVSVVGTMAGIAAAIAIVGVSALHHGLGSSALGSSKALVFVAACAGLFFDSLLGATVERRGWVGNDLVNFASTLFSAVVAVGLRNAMR
jgi:uncharacterized protein (TIGR00297 family)